MCKFASKALQCNLAFFVCLPSALGSSEMGRRQVLSIIPLSQGGTLLRPVVRTRKAKCVLCPMEVVRERRFVFVPLAAQTNTSFRFSLIDQPLPRSTVLRRSNFTSCVISIHIHYDTTTLFCPLPPPPLPPPPTPPPFS